MSRLKIQRAEREASPSGSVASWLDVLEALLGLPPEEAKAIREELASHLQERVRDLTVTGKSESEAIQAAISELGDAAELARRYQQARGRTTRSTIMQVALVSAVAVALTAGGFAVRGASEARQQAAAARERELMAKVSAYKAVTAAALANGEAQPGAQGENLLAGTELFELDDADGVVVSVTPTQTWGDLMQQVAQATKRTLVANAASMNSSGLAPGANVGLEIHEMPLAEALRLLQEHTDASRDPLEYRTSGTVIEFASRSHFDRREVQTRTYDLGVLAQALLDKEAAGPAPRDEERHTRISAEETVSEQVTELMQSLVNPDMWQNNGGELGSVRRYGSKLFVTAPRRHFARIEWVLKECGAFEKTRAGAESPANTGRLTVAFDPTTRRLSITDDQGRVAHCSALVVDTPYAVNALLSDASVEQSVPMLSELPLLQTNFKSRTPLVNLLAPAAKPGEAAPEEAAAPSSEK